jgi:hypothetical protein
MSIATDVRSYADTALAQGKAALSNAGNAAVLVNKRLVADAPKPAYAALGAADLVASAVSRRVEALPAEAARTQNDAIARLSELRDRLDTSLGSVSGLPVFARNATEAYLSTAKELYGKLTARGEAKAAELRNDPRVGRLFGQVGEVAGSVQSTVSPVVKSAFDAVESMSPVQAKSAARPAARKAASAAGSATRNTSTRVAHTSTTAKSTTARSTTAKSTTAKSPATKSAAAKGSATKSTAAKRTTTGTK